MGQLVFQATLGGQVNLVGPNTASTFNLNVPAVAGTLVTTGDTGTVTNTMLAGSIANAKLSNSSVTVGSTSIALGATATTVAGLTSLATNTLTSAAATALTLQSAGTTAITIDTSQNVGIGITSPTRKLAVSGTWTNTGDYLMDSGSPQLAWTSGDLRFKYGGLAGTEAMRIDSSGNVGIGTTSPTGKFQVVGTGGNVYFDNNGFVNSTQALDDATAGGRFSGYSNQGKLGEIAIEQTTISTKGGYIRLSTCASGSNSPTERMRINSSGEVLVNGTASPVNGLKMAITNGSVKWSFGPDGSGNYCVFNASGTGVYVTNGGTSWTGTSDERLKTDLIPITNGLQKVNSLRSVTGRFKTDEEGTSRSFLIAQDVQAVFPEAVNTLNDEIGTLGLAYTDVIPLLVSAIKELKAINDTQAETLTQQTEAINAQSAALAALTARIVDLEAK